MSRLVYVLLMTLLCGYHPPSFLARAQTTPLPPAALQENSYIIDAARCKTYGSYGRYICDSNAYIPPNTLARDDVPGVLKSRQFQKPLTTTDCAFGNILDLSEATCSRAAQPYVPPATPAAPKTAPAQEGVLKDTVDKTADNVPRTEGDDQTALTKKCREENEKAATAACAAAGSQVAASACVERFRTYVDSRSIVPYQTSDFSPLGEITKAGKVTGECKALATTGTCARCKGDGYARVPGSINNNADTYKGYTQCNPSASSQKKAETKNVDQELQNETSLPIVGQDLFICRVRGHTPSSKDPGETKRTPSDNQNRLNERPAGGGITPTPSRTNMSLGDVGSLLTGIGTLLKAVMPNGLMGGQGGPAAQPADPCSLVNAQTNPACNPAIPTIPPVCGDSILKPLTVSPSTIYSGQSGMISWYLSGKGTITSVITYATTDVNGRPLSGSFGQTLGATGTKEIVPDRSTTYTLKATNEVGSVTCPPVRVLVRPKTESDDAEEVARGIDPNELRISCEPSSYVVASGERPVVSWDGCPSSTTSTVGLSTEDGAFTTHGMVRGSVDVSPLRDSSYVVRCKNKYNEEVGRASCRIDVESATTSADAQVRSKPSVQISISKQSPVIEYGESIRVMWSSKNAASCTIYGPGCTRFGRSSSKCFKEIGRSGFVVGNLYETSTFSAECRGADRKTTVADEITIEVHQESHEDTSYIQSSASTVAPTSVAPAVGVGTSLDEMLME